jgi:hypothetical protein
MRRFGSDASADMSPGACTHKEHNSNTLGTHEEQISVRAEKYTHIHIHTHAYRSNVIAREAELVEGLNIVWV